MCSANSLGYHTVILFVLTQVVKWSEHYQLQLTIDHNIVGVNDFAHAQLDNRNPS